MEISELVLLGSLVLAATLFFISLYNNIQRKLKWTKFMSLGLLNLAFSCGLILYFGKDNMSLNLARNVAIATLVFMVLSMIFYGTYQITKEQSSTNNK